MTNKVGKSTSPASNDAAVPSIDRAKRYDRGIRVWGAHGQDAMEKARVCLLNASATGSEALKNLVLGGIHSFAIVDGRNVAPEDVGNNYLVTSAAVGRQSRAQCVTECLKELNETVSGSFVEEDPVKLIATNPEFFEGFTLVIASQLPEGPALALDALCRERGVMLLLARSYGLMGYIRNCVAEHCVVESKPDSEVHDLRLDNPWPELEAAAAAVDLDSLDDAEHSHVPYGLLLVKAAAAWKASHGGQFPKTYAERSEFKDLLRSWQRSIDGFPIQEENFTEAVASAHKVWAPATLGPELKAILDDAAPLTITKATPIFWIAAAALSRFIRDSSAGAPPLEGSLPDMHATTQRYLDLQGVYRRKAEADAAAVQAHVREILTAAGRDPESIPAPEVRRFCRHARHLRVVRCRPLKEGLSADVLRAALTSEGIIQANATLLVLLKAVDRFLAQHQRVPGAFDGEVEEDVVALKALAGAVLMESGVSGVALCDDLVGEMVRCGGGELHAVASVVGAMVSQEAIKLMTKQFVPVGGAMVFNAMACTTSVLG